MLRSSVAKHGATSDSRFSVDSRDGFALVFTGNSKWCFATSEFSVIILSLPLGNDNASKTGHYLAPCAKYIQAKIFYQQMC